MRRALRSSSSRATHQRPSRFMAHLELLHGPGVYGRMTPDSGQKSGGLLRSGPDLRPPDARERKNVENNIFSRRPLGTGLPHLTGPMREGENHLLRRPGASGLAGRRVPSWSGDGNLQVSPDAASTPPIGPYLSGCPTFWTRLLSGAERISCPPADPWPSDYLRSCLSWSQSTGLKGRRTVVRPGQDRGKKRAVFAVLDSAFLMASMGTAVGGRHKKRKRDKEKNRGRWAAPPGTPEKRSCPLV